MRLILWISLVLGVGVTNALIGRCIKEKSINGINAIKSTHILGAALLDSTKDFQLTIGAGNGKYHIKAFEAEEVTDQDDVKLSSEGDREDNVIQLLDVRSGWGNGAHPTTKLCMEFVLENVKSGTGNFLDYGTGSGILSILSAKQGAERCIAVDIDEDSIMAACSNMRLNRVDSIVDVVHTREMYVGNDMPLADITVANILPGALNRLAPLLVMLTKPGGLIALSGLRPTQLEAIKRIYEPFVEPATEDTRQASHDIYGDWVMWSAVTRVPDKETRTKLMELLSENSVEKCH